MFSLNLVRLLQCGQSFFSTFFLLGISLQMGCSQAPNNSLAKDGGISNLSSETLPDSKSDGSGKEVDPNGEKVESLNLPLDCGTCSPMGVMSIATNQVFQRKQNNYANIPIKLSLVTGKSIIRVVSLRASDDSIASELVLNEALTSAPGAEFSSTIELKAGGWYNLIIQEISPDKTKILSQGTVSRVGVGEIFLTLGQGNAIAKGEKPQINSSLSSGATIGANDVLKWTTQIDDDSGSGGSPWPILATRLTDYFQIPVAIVSLGCEGTRVASWLPSDSGALAAPQCGTDTAAPGGLFNRLQSTIENLGDVRAILWMQGESDASDATNQANYVSRLQVIVNRLNQETGRTGNPLNWIVAKSSYIPGNEIDIANKCALKSASISNYSKMKPIRLAQNQLWKSGLVKEGPDLDGFIGPNFRFTNNGQTGCGAFSNSGLKMVGRLWYQKISEANIISGSELPPVVETQTVTRFFKSGGGGDHLLLNVPTNTTISGYKTEGEVFRTYKSALPNGMSTELIRCLFKGENHFLSTLQNCEDQTKENSNIGFIATQPQLGTRPLFRYYSSSADIVTTLDIDEVLEHGFFFNSLVGFVPHSF